jgi:S-DNA-T family DNA segregation ATPase FtsK/SpoIIIE
VSVFATAAFMGTLFLLPVMLQQVRGASALESGLTTFPEALGVLACSQLVGRLYARVGPRALMVVGLAAMGLLLVAVSRVGLDTSDWTIRGLMFALGGSFSFLIIALQASSFATITPADTGRASALYNTQRQVSQALGVAILASTLAAFAEHTRITVPPLLALDVTDYGVVAEFSTVPGVGMKQFADRAEGLADHWRAVRVAVERPESGLIRLTVMHTDPLTEKTIAAVPPRPARLDRVPAGLDRTGRVRFLRLANSAGIGIYGVPGFGKSAFLRWLITRLAPSKAVQFVVLDGKPSGGTDGDYAELAPRLAAVVGDDLAEANGLLQQMVEFRRWRASTIRRELGVTNLWDVGPSQRWPIVLVIVDEAHTFLQIVRNATGALKRRNALAAHNLLLLEDLHKKGRNVGVIPVLATQKGTADSLPTNLRDVQTAKICFAVDTLESAIAALGPAITNYPDANPITFLDDDYRGVASMKAEGEPGYVQFRVPFVPADQAAAVATATAHYVTDAAIPALTVGTAHRRASTGPALPEPEAPAPETGPTAPEPEAPAPETGPAAPDPVTTPAEPEPGSEPADERGELPGDTAEDGQAATGRDRCKYCGDPITQTRGGRRREYCSPDHRAKFHRERAKRGRAPGIPER